MQVTARNGTLTRRSGYEMKYKSNTETFNAIGTVEIPDGSHLVDMYADTIHGVKVFVAVWLEPVEESQ